MRRQDETFLLYPRTPPDGQRLLISQLEGSAAQFDYPRVAEFLASECRSADPWIRYLSSLSRQTLEPEFHSRELGFRSGSRGIHSRFYADPELLDGSAAGKARSAQLQKAAWA